MSVDLQCPLPRPVLKKEGAIMEGSKKSYVKNLTQVLSELAQVPYLHEIGLECKSQYIL